MKNFSSRHILVWLSSFMLSGAICAADIATEKLPEQSSNQIQQNTKLEMEESFSLLSLLASVSSFVREVKVNWSYEAPEPTSEQPLPEPLEQPSEEQPIKQLADPFEQPLEQLGSRIETLTRGGGKMINSLTLAILERNYDEVWRLVLDKKWPVDAPGTEGLTAVDCALKVHDNSVLRLLLTKGVFAKTTKGAAKEWIFTAAASGDLEAVDMLIKKFPRQISYRAAKIATIVGNSQILTRFLYLDRSLAQATDEDGKTLLYWAASVEPDEPHPGVAKALMFFGANPDFVPENSNVVKESPMRVAKRKHRHALVFEMEKTKPFKAISDGKVLKLFWLKN